MKRVVSVAATLTTSCRFILRTWRVVSSCPCGSKSFKVSTLKEYRVKLFPSPHAEQPGPALVTGFTTSVTALTCAECSWEAMNQDDFGSDTRGKLITGGIETVHKIDFNNPN